MEILTSSNDTCLDSRVGSKYYNKVILLSKTQGSLFKGTRKPCPSKHSTPDEQTTRPSNVDPSSLSLGRKVLAYLTSDDTN